MTRDNCYGKIHTMTQKDVEQTVCCPVLVRGGVPSKLCTLTGLGDGSQRLVKCPANRNRTASLVSDCTAVSPKALAIIEQSPEYIEREKAHRSHRPNLIG